MAIEGWKYYHHAAVPRCALHEHVDLKPVISGLVWDSEQIGGKGKVLFARYITDFDCKEETSFWYIIKKGPFIFDELDKKYRKNVLKALERSEAMRVDPSIYADEIYDVYKEAFAKYENAGTITSEQSFNQYLNKCTDDFWVAFCRDTGKIAGWMTCRNHGDWTETISAKYHPGLQSYRPSDTIHYAVLDYYLNELNQKFIESGSRNINHKTNVQDYKIKNWKFQRAYCKLHIIYNPKYSWLIKSIYPFRSILRLFDNHTLIHQINSLLVMEEITRE